MKRILFLGVSAAVVSLVAGCALFYPNIGNSQSPSDPMNPTPSTMESTEASSTPSPSESPAISKQKAKPMITFTEIDYGSMMLLVVAEVVNVAEASGTCSVRFVSEGKTVYEGSVKAEENVATMQCYPINIPLGELPTGTGVIVVTYESENYLGSSEDFEVEIP